MEKPTNLSYLNLIELFVVPIRGVCIPRQRDAEEDTRTTNAIVYIRAVDSVIFAEEVVELFRLVVPRILQHAGYVAKRVIGRYGQQASVE